MILFADGACWDFRKRLIADNFYIPSFVLIIRKSCAYQLTVIMVENIRCYDIVSTAHP